MKISKPFSVIISASRLFPRPRRWGDNDKYWGPFTYAHDPKYKPLVIVLDSGEPEYPGCTFRIQGFGHTLILSLPPIIKPWKRWVDTSHYEWSNSPNSGYWDVHSKEYGFNYVNGHLSVYLGPQTHDSETTKRWGKFIPWANWRHVRFSLYDLNGEHFWTETKRSKGEDPIDHSWSRWSAAEEVPKTSFDFFDYDGERITATTHIEEREFRFGEGWFKWLSLFRKPRIHRDLSIEFSSEVGRKKGSWKGGTVGHSIDMNPSELHQETFARYCDKHDLQYIGPSTSAG